MISFVDTLTEALDRNEYVISLFIDLSKAFDTIDHVILMKKLYNYGIRGIAYDFIKSFISDRSQCVEMNGVTSNFLDISCGVPQGSTLGPVLFLLYINDIHLYTNLLKLILFADDTTILYSSKNLKHLIDNLNNELMNLSEWFILNKLSLNIAKTNYMLFHNRKNHITHSDLFIGTNRLSNVQSVKFLGVEVDVKLSWLNHIRSIEKKLSSANYIIRSIRYKINRNTALKLYDTLVLPYLTYCNIVWGQSHKCHIAHISRLQKRTLRTCCQDNTIPKHDLFLTTNKLSFPNINKYQILQITFNYFYNEKILPDSIMLLFKKTVDIHSFHTRSTDTMCLFTHYARLNIRKTCLKVYAPVLWNSVPISLRQINSLQLFKSKLKIFLLANHDI